MAYSRGRNNDQLCCVHELRGPTQPPVYVISAPVMVRLVRQHLQHSQPSVFNPYGSASRAERHCAYNHTRIELLIPPSRLTA